MGMSKNIKVREVSVTSGEGTFGRVRRIGSGLVETERYEFVDGGSKMWPRIVREDMTEVEARAWATAILDVLE